MTQTLTGRVSGSADGRLEEVITLLEGYARNDPDLSFQAAAYHDGRLILDVWSGRHMAEDSMIVPYSVTKNTIGICIGLLVQRGLLDLDERVAHYWPEFASKGKQHVTVRMLLSHQAGLPQANPPLTWDELLDHHAAALRLADSWPLWYPGSAFGYHAMTIGNLASELVYRTVGRTLHEFFEEEVRRPFDIDFYLGLPSHLDFRRVPVLPMVRPVVDRAPRYGSALTGLVMATPGPALDLGNDERSWRFGHPAASGVGSARGVARMMAAAVTGLDGTPPFLRCDTVEQIGQQQVRGYDEVLGQPDRAHAVVFQKPTSELNFGGPRSFGHDGALGGLACVDPDTGVAVGYTVARAPWPGGADPRAMALAAMLNELLA
jgi:CubicO group peptidase (beta-lactamase class C family)